MHIPRFVVHRRVCLWAVLVAGTLLLGAVALNLQAGIVIAQGPQPQRPQVALGTGFAYQGQLKKNGSAVTDPNCSMTFNLWDSQSGGAQMGGNDTQTVTVANGLFTVVLNAGNQFGTGAFNGEARWLQAAVQCTDDSSPVTLSRQALTPAPQALTLGAPGSVYGYVAYATNPTIGFNTYGDTYSAGVSGYGGIFQFQNGDGKLTYYTGSNVAAGAPHANAPRVTIATNGNVGIGTTDLDRRLTVRGPDSLPSTAAFGVVNSANEITLLAYDDGTLQIGATRSSSTIHACYTYLGFAFAACSSAAEYVPTIDDGMGYAEAADLVSIAPSVKNPYGDEHSPFVVTKSNKPCDDNLLGFIVNPESGADGKKLNEHYLPVAIYGYFPAKVTLENGAIKRGDPLTSSSKPGYGMKATQTCKVIGYALEDADQEGTIQVFANHGESATAEVATLRTQVKTQAEQIATLSARLDALEKAAKPVSAPPLAAR